MPVEVAVSNNHPLMKAWNAYKASPEYANTLGWASQPQHTEGSLWAAFERGYRSYERFPMEDRTPDARPPQADGERLHPVNLERRVAALERMVALLQKKSLTPDEAREVLGLPSGEGEPPT
jgi:hypothetical protein